MIIAVKTKRDLIWLVPTIIFGLSVTLAWGAFLVWVVYRVSQLM
jgi:hypothetical protein